MSVRMTNCGPLGWVTDKERGYRYQATHPETGKPWPPIPPMLLDLWDEIARYPAPPEACLVNYYAGDAKMGLHQDRDEEDFAAPVLSVSLGDTGVFRVGGPSRKDPTQKFELRSGDVVVLGGGRSARSSRHRPHRERHVGSARRRRQVQSHSAPRHQADAKLAQSPGHPPSGKSSLAALRAAASPSPCALACFAPPLATATKAGLRQRSPMA